MEMIPGLKNAVWERQDGDLHVMVDQRQMVTLSDENGEIEALLELLLAAPLTIDALAGKLSATFPHMTPADVAEGIAGLDSLGLLENAAKAGALSDWQRERYFSNLVFFQSFASLERSAEQMQRRLVDAHVLVLGTGGLGGTVLMHLVGLGIGRLTLVEPDVVELRNFSRQYVYRHADIARAKVERAEEWVREYDPTIEVRAVNRRIASTGDVAELLPGVDLVIAGIDTPRFSVGSWINDTCVAAGVPHVRGGMGIQSQYYSVDPGRSACVECDRLVVQAEEQEPGSVGARWRLMHRLDTINRGVGPIAGHIGALMAMEALRYLTRFTDPVSAGVLHTFDLTAGGAETLTPWPKRDDCPVCRTAGNARSAA